MLSSNLRAVLRIKTMARAAISETELITSDAGWEMASAYKRLRSEARELNIRAGWGNEEDFDRELPPIAGAFDHVTTVRALGSNDVPDNAISWGRRARVLLGQLAAWAEGHQQAFELEAQFKAIAEARAQAAAAEANAAVAPPFGFADR